MALRQEPPPYPTAGAVRLKPLLDLEPREWARFHAYFRDREIAEWNGSRPLRMPLWLFRRVVAGEERGGERFGFGIFAADDERPGTERFIGSVELYDVTPARPRPPLEATLGIIIGEESCWGLGYGTLACRAVLEHAFSGLGLERVRLSTFEHNRRARRAFEKAGFRLERIGEPRAGRRDAHYSLDRTTWQEQRNRV